MKTRVAISMLAAGRLGTLSGRVSGPDGPLEDVTITQKKGYEKWMCGTDTSVGDRHRQECLCHTSKMHVRQRYVVDDGKQTNVDLKLAAATPR